MVSRCGHVALHPVLDGVSGIVERSVRRALGVQVLREPMIEPATLRGRMVRQVLVECGTRRWEGPVRGQDLEPPPGKGQDGFINHTEAGRIGFVVDKLRTPPVVENDGVAPHFDGKPRIPLLWQDRSGDQTLGTRAQLRPGFTT